MRTVSADLRITVQAPAELIFQVAAAGADAAETVDLTADGAALGFTEVPGPTGGRQWLVDAPAGRVELHYRAEVPDRTTPPAVTTGERLLYARPSRYCESDRMLGLAATLFRDVGSPRELLPAVSSWVGGHLAYVSGSSGPTDGAVDTLLGARGVCRDFAHLTVALLRALDVPARLTAVYAPGLHPMDFHAVAEALVDDTWYVVDSTLLAPRASLVRIATGRDAADTAFLTSSGGDIVLDEVTVSAVVDGDLPREDVTELVTLA